VREVELQLFRKEINAELHQLLNWWIMHTPDQKYGGFIGKIDNQNKADQQAVKGLVLHTRILYTFAAAYRLTEQPNYIL
jgi:mannobiose 2-epimerase